jgi:TRAP-type C4-dicarboxylate transport system permease small subunit
MLDILRRVEEKLVRFEGWLLVFLVSLMLLLAVYNVIYRNVLVPFQAKITIQESSVTAPVGDVVHHETSSSPEPSDPLPASDDSAGGFGGGFGGDFADDSAEADSAAGFGGDFAEKPVEADGAAGFGGDFADKPVEKPTAEADESEGFGGGFGAETENADEGFGGGFGGEFADKEQPSAEPSSTTEVRVESVKPELSAFAKFVDEFVYAVKLEWIDILLRHLVLVVGFLGAMLATHRRKHITIDALSKIIPLRFHPWLDMVTGTLAAVICGFFAVSGRDLVMISREFPKEIMWWADEWAFQMVFPIGFALLSFHFTIRVFEAIDRGLHGEEARGEA